MKLNCRVNEEDVQADIPPRLLLSDFLRHELRLTGTHVGCEMGACGACTVTLDGLAVRSCLVFAVQADGCSIRTVESLSPDGRLSDVQHAFRKHHALQCGFCTAGILMTVVAAMDRNALPSTEEGVREMLSGNICRCTGYQGIVDAVLELAETQRGVDSLRADIDRPKDIPEPLPRFNSLSRSKRDSSFPSTVE
jgi:aerobic-type carbon monoxide dehydrogenase small subunit (CoxS/CutS family)